MNNTTDNERSLWVGAEPNLLTPEDLQRRFGPLIDRGVEALESCLRTRIAQRPAFTLAGVKLWFEEGMQVLDAGAAVLANVLQPLPQPAPAWRGRSLDGDRSPAEKTDGPPSGRSAPSSVRSAVQEGHGCRVRLDVEDDSAHPRRLRVQLALLTPTGERIRPIRVTVRDAAGRFFVNRVLSKGWSFAQSNVKPQSYAFRVEDESGARWAECRLGADPIDDD